MGNKKFIYKTIEDIKLYKKNEINFIFFKSIISNTNIPFYLREKAYYNLNYLFKNKRKVKIKLRCLLTGNNRSRYSFFGISRIKIRDLASYNLLNGIRKSSW